MTTLNSRTCPQCGYITTLDAPFCTQCGTALAAATYQQPSQPYPPYQQPSQPYPTYQQPSQPYPPYQQPPQYPIQPVAYGQQPYYVPPTMYAKNKVAAALLAFFLGGFGIHGFYLGNTTMGVILLALSFVSIPLTCAFGIGLIGFSLVGLICLVQTIMYLITDDYTFYQKYVVEKRWF